MRIGWCVVVVAFGSAGCRGHRGILRPPATPTRSAAECAPLVKRARAEGMSPRAQPPMLQGELSPPRPSPQELRGRSLEVRLVVDERGRVDVGSITVLGYSNVGYNSKLRLSASQLRFAPAVLEGCAIPQRTVVRYTFE
ncbi:MAG: hypothetical protein M3068_01675 [Gemmatimonadota bacterium]|nr:hypothetical protein [Gemmatimonadota bacterium]